MSRNSHLHTSTDEATARILKAMATLPEHGVGMSGLATIAFPDYTFRSAQGAALAVSRIARKMIADGLLGHNFRGYGYRITRAGIERAGELSAGAPASSTKD